MTGSAQSEWTPSASFWRHRPVAVTGPTGFAGSHLVRTLVELQADVAAILGDEVVPGWLAECPTAAVIRGDIADEATLGRLLAERRVASVFHLAGQDRAWVADAAPIPTFEGTIAGTWSLLDAVRRVPSIGEVVVCSSDAAYGAPAATPCTEDTSPVATTALDVSRACADMVAGVFARTYGLPVVIGRCPTLFGPGETDWARLVPSVTRSLVEGHPPQIREDGRLSRDYLFVADAVLALLKLAESLAERPALTGQIFNFSAERPVTLVELVEMLQIAAGTHLEPDFVEAGPPEVLVRHLSAAKAHEVLGWQPQHTFEEAVLVTVAWYRRALCPGPA